MNIYDNMENFVEDPIILRLLSRVEEETEEDMWRAVRPRHVHISIRIRVREDGER